MKRSVKNHDSVEVDDEYGTPKEKYNAICKKLGMFPKLDVCGSEKNHVVNNYWEIDTIITDTLYHRSYSFDTKNYYTRQLITRDTIWKTKN